MAGNAPLFRFNGSRLDTVAIVQAELTAACTETLDALAKLPQAGDSRAGATQRLVTATYDRLGAIRLRCVIERADAVVTMDGRDDAEFFSFLEPLLTCDRRGNVTPCALWADWSAAHILPDSYEGTASVRVEPRPAPHEFNADPDDIYNTPCFRMDVTYRADLYATEYHPDGRRLAGFKFR